MKPAHRLRQVVNIINLSTPLGLLLIVAGTRRPAVHRGPDGLLVAGRYRLPLPDAHAFTCGNVILVRSEAADLLDRPRLLLHEGRHATQYAFCFGPFMIVAYLACAGVSLALCGDHSSYNPFERLAGLADGGYERRPLRAFRRRP
ncbi:hypothetical protein [Actinomadura rudentiformis]|uniref:DUF4157 domain-containing protein n=1 Tax=Actinomadura rudentiformis TaxID=359158 RepID=A0A6H9YU85_9ACTN|nr:hypothetical protein [Actinomadura rudentiformis]KAB2352167.1 hypothetical protein F8566_00090 [Actinomadura rudentiformis]